MNGRSSGTDPTRATMPPLWECPKCGRKFANRNQEHSFGKYTVEDFLLGKGQRAKSLYRAFEKLVLVLGRVSLAPAKTRVGFQARMIFAAVNKLSGSKLEAHVVLARRLECPRFTKIESISPRNHVHHFTVRDVRELNGEVIAWLEEAHHVGLQHHLRR